MRNSTVAIIVSTVALAVGILFVWGPELYFGLQMKLEAYRKDPFAVYLDSGHIFYGNLVSISSKDIVLSNVRSFQKFEVGQSTTNTLQSQSSNPITKPNNYLVIDRSHVLFYEQIGSNAPILSQGVSTQ